MTAVADTANNGKLTFEKILTLHREVESKLVKMGRMADKIRKLLMHLYQSPIVNVKEVEDLLSINYFPSNSLIKTLVDAGILHETTSYARNRIFVFQQYNDNFTT